MTTTKEQLLKSLENLDDNVSLYVRTTDESMECEIVTSDDIIEEYRDKVFEDEDDNDEEIDINDTIQALADFDDSIQFYEIS